MRKCDRCDHAGPVPDEVTYGWCEVKGRMRMLRLCLPCWDIAREWARREKNNAIPEKPGSTFVPRVKHAIDPRTHRHQPHHSRV